MMLSQTAMYAVKAMGFIANYGNNEPVLSKVISRELDIPQNFLSKIMHRLVQEGFLRSTRGTNGGFVLTRDPKKISMHDIAGLFMNLSDLNRCFLGLPECNGSCSLHKQWIPIADRFLGLLEKTSIDRVTVPVSELQTKAMEV